MISHYIVIHLSIEIIYIDLFGLCVCLDYYWLLSVVFASRWFPLIQSLAYPSLFIASFSHSLFNYPHSPTLTPHHLSSPALGPFSPIYSPLPSLHNLPLSSYPSLTPYQTQTPNNIPTEVFSQIIQYTRHTISISPSHTTSPTSALPKPDLNKKWKSTILKTIMSIPIYLYMSKTSIIIITPSSLSISPQSPSPPNILQPIPLFLSPSPSISLSTPPLSICSSHHNPHP